MMQRHILSSLLRDPRGVTAVEFAIILPALLTLLCGTLEIGHMLLARQMLEGAVVEAARLATASLETKEADRTNAMRNSITKSMSMFPTAPGKQIEISTTVYADFNSATPEVYTDTNKNGAFDAGEPYVDRNKNGKWDPALPKTGTLGGPGDVVSYTVRFPKRILFGFLARPLGLGNTAIPLAATTVMRNEAVVQKTVI